jgi:HAMP domain-containing protein
VRASNQADTVGKPYARASGEELGKRGDSVAVTSFRSASGATILDFEAPIAFQGKTIGRVHLDIPEQPLSRVARLSMGMMALLVAITVLAVALTTYLMGKRVAKPVRQLETAMGRIAKGELDYRIAEQRKDEFGQLYHAFDNMAQALEKGPSEPAPPQDAVAPVP